MKIIKVLAFVAFVGVVVYLFVPGFQSPSNEQVSDNVRRMLQDKLSSDDRLSKFGMKVNSVTVIRVEGNQYRGVAIIDLHGKTHEVSIDVTADNQSVMFNAPSGSFAFAFQEDAQAVGL